jgi:Ca2+-binding RTX toxin-like protein
MRLVSNEAGSVPLAFTLETMSTDRDILTTISVTSGANNLTGSVGNDPITGLADDDTISPGTGIDTVDGGAGTDTLVVDYSGVHSSGITYNLYNTITRTGRFYAYTNPSNTTYDQITYANIEKFEIVGTANNDDLRGGTSNDLLQAGGGDDTLIAGGGVDIIDGGVGIDSVDVDVATTASANTIDLSNANNTLANGTQLRNIERFAYLKTGAGADLITAGNYDDTINSGAGNDTIDAKDGNNTIDAGAGADSVTTGSGNDKIVGGDGNDRILTGIGDDSIEGGNGDDTINPGNGVDTVDGGAGIDTLVVDYANVLSSGITFNLYAPTTGTGRFYAYTNVSKTTYDQVTYSNIEQVDITGTANNDDLRGGIGNDILKAGAGDDTLTDDGGIDIIDGGAGTDHIYLDLARTAGNNTIDLNRVSNTLANGTQLLNIERFATFITGAGNDHITAAIGNYDDTINSGAGNDTIDAKDGANIVNGGDGNDRILTGIGSDSIEGGNGDDTINPGNGVDTVDGGAGIDTLVVDYAGVLTSGITFNLYAPATKTGRFYAYTNLSKTTYDQVTYSNIEQIDITGTVNADDLRGGNGNDLLRAGAGNDTISGGAGNDTIIGVSSNDPKPGNNEIDTLTGDADQDIFVLAANSKDFYTSSGNGDYAKITDFSLTQDTIQLRGTATDYSVTPTTIGDVPTPSTALYRGSELIAVLQGINSTSVDLTSSAFRYTDDPIVSIPNVTPIININDVRVTEGDSGTKDLTFTVALNKASQDIVKVRYATENSTAKAGSDYLSTSGNLDFSPGETSKTIAVKINGDSLVEDNETLYLNLTTAVSGTLGKTVGIGTITNNDSPDLDINIPEIEQPPVVVDPNPVIPPVIVSQNNQPLGSSRQNIRAIIDLQSVSNNQNVQATFSIQRSAGYDNHVSFYKIEDAQGTIISQAGVRLKPGDAGYLTTAIQNRLTNIDLLGINGQTISSRSNIRGGAIYAPLIIANDRPDSANLNLSHVYTAYSAANADKTEHIRLLSDNTFGFEDLHGGGDKDFNDTIVTADFTVTPNPQDLVLDLVKLSTTPTTSTLVNLNLTSYEGQTLKVDLITTSNAAYHNQIGFYPVEDSIGSIKLRDGSLLKPGDANYAIEAIKNAVTNSLPAGKTDLNLAGRKNYAPVVTAQGTFSDFIFKNPSNGGGANNIHAYFNYVGANADKTDHFRLIENNTFGVEDMYGGGDSDFNDLVVSIKVKA